MKVVRQAFHDQHSIGVNDEVGWGSAECGVAAKVDVPEIEKAGTAVMAYVAGVEDLGLTASAEEVVLAESSLVVGAVMTQDVLGREAARAGVELELVSEPSELLLPRGSSFALREPRLWRC